MIREEDEHHRSARSDGLAALAYPEFRRLYVGTVAAHMGRWMEQFTIGWLVIQLAIRDGRPELGSLYLALTGLARLAPILAFGFIGGMSADRYDRRDVLRLTRLVIAAVAGLLAALTLGDRIDMMGVLVLTAISASAFSFDGPATISLGPMLVGQKQALGAISLTRATIHATSLIGPLVAGVLIAPVGIGGVLVLIAVLALLSRIVISGLHPIPPLPSARDVSALRSMVDAGSYLRHEPTLRIFMMSSVLLAILGGSFGQLLPAVAHDTFGVGARELSWLAGALAMGTLGGALVVTTMHAWTRPGRVILGSGAALGILIVMFGLQREYAPALLLAAFVGLASMTCNGGIGNITQTTMPDGLRGRLLGIQMTVWQGGMHFGTLVLGALGAVFGISNVLAAAGLAIVVTILALSRVDTVRDARVHGDRVAEPAPR